MKKLWIFAFVIGAIWMVSCNVSNDVSMEKALDGINQEDLHRQVATLAADTFWGRKPCTIGEKVSLKYLQDEYRKIGLNPAFGDSYLQEVPLMNVTGTPDEYLSVSTQRGTLQLKHKTEFVAFSRKVKRSVGLNNSELVFAGYGIVAPEYNWNDYKDLDVKGKTVVVLVNDPGYALMDSSLFNGRNMTYYGRWTYKYEEAARQGAAGCLIVHDTGGAGYPFSVVLSGATIPKLYLKPVDGNRLRCEVEGWLTGAAAQKLFATCGLDWDQLRNRAAQKPFKAVPMRAQANLQIQQRFDYDVSHNVGGMIKGRNRADELLIYTAHWDHLGVGNVMDGDSIYNGAVDNGTSLAWMLEIAEAFSQLSEKPRRSVLFLATTAEEQGLQGAYWYTKNPILPLQQTVANINNDLMLPYGLMKDVMITGFGQSELEDYVEQAAKKQGRYLVPDPTPETGMFYRADHFPFARVGVPALFARGNTDHMRYGKAWMAEKEKAWLANNYHKPTDEYNAESWDLEGVEQDAKLLFMVGYELANSDLFPNWKEGSEFKSVRDSMMKQ